MDRTVENLSVLLASLLTSLLNYKYNNYIFDCLVNSKCLYLYELNKFCIIVSDIFKVIEDPATDKDGACAQFSPKL